MAQDVDGDGLELRVIRPAVEESPCCIGLGVVGAMDADHAERVGGNVLGDKRRKRA